ncbi:MAG: primosomal protein DnaI [Caldibacillus debilis]|uniref:Primosomal protein DnaI n=1 Tax=Caldibacillus debilis TaxID=301148 RepID=A0A150MB06_9BACI|nr:primosomal protein DnaI [Caldibacillus debilis]MBO2481096.1 primosomal protein DnaI [Bacillaceae bacterium]KYD21626.1 hypothetical protein B4135_1634 [Caldibacillus debilis]MBY6271734.1 primosomal protein DnaI [Bacillaceae bacterium]OUM93076.1 MAG: primosomal protein DnaI [Caldibacillus debilis]REJ17437.1 MAG: primosomal protein DnaI [Caldibacillus debilis]
MKRIDETLRNIAGNLPPLEKSLRELKEEILQHPDIRSFLEENKAHISDGMVERSLGKLYEYTQQVKGCKGCPSLEGCKNLIPGYEPELVFTANAIDLRYLPCRTKKMEEERRRMEGIIECIHMPDEVLKAAMSDMIIDTENRFKAVKKAKDFINRYDGKTFIKGLYLYGAFGTGKTYILAAIANGLKQKKIPSVLVYVPELIREMKQSLSEHTTGEKVDKLKRAPVLMFDDIGAETMSSWVRDEILGPILQHRMQEKLPTFFSSNFDLRELKLHFTYSQKGEEEQVKAARIIERIQFLAEPVMIDGANKRLHSE